MWIFTKFGFFSVVLAEGGSLQIRARRRCHLQALRKNFPELSKHEILHTPHADYRWRMIAEHDVVAQVMMALVMQIDYSNFKSEVAKNGPTDPDGASRKRGEGYLGALHDVWGTMHALQRWETVFAG